MEHKILWNTSTLFIKRGLLISSRQTDIVFLRFIDPETQKVEWCAIKKLDKGFCLF